MHKVAFMNPWLKDKPQSFTQRHMQHAFSKNVASGGGGVWYPGYLTDFLIDFLIDFQIDLFALLNLKSLFDFEVRNHGCSN